MYVVVTSSIASYCTGSLEHSCQSLLAFCLGLDCTKRQTEGRAGCVRNATGGTRLHGLAPEFVA
jgi:hypothetical protein